LLAKLLAKFDAEHTIQILGSSFTFTLDLPFSWKVFYFSSVAIAAGTFVYTIRCPVLIKAFRGYPDYERDGKSQLVLKLAMLQHVKKTQGTDELESFAKLFCEPALPDERKQGHAPISVKDFVMRWQILPENLPDAFHFARGTASTWYPIARISCWFCYAIGFLLLFWVFVETLRFVVEFTVERA